MFRGKIVVKSVTFLSLLLVILVAIFIFAASQRESKIYYEQLQTEFKVIANLFEHQSDLIEKARARIDAQADWSTDPDARALKAYLDRIVGEGKVVNSFVYYPDTFEKNGKMHVRFLQANDDVEKMGFVPQTEYELPDEFVEAFGQIEKTGIGSTGLYKDEYGAWLTILAPLHDADGKRIAYLGIDFLLDEIVADLNASFWSLTLIGVIAGGICIILIGALIRFTLRGVLALNRTTMDAAEGDLTVEIPSAGRDEIGKLAESFKRMIENFRAMIINVQDTVHKVNNSSETLQEAAGGSAAATDELVASLKSLAVGAEGQTMSAQESERVMEEMAIGIQRIAEAASIVAELSTAVAKEAEQGAVIVAEATGQMEQINETAGETVTAMKDLQMHSDEIAQAVTAIGGIATQTNLLALNASIEAARAGEHGKGFAVVAEEIRKLANQSKLASEKIVEMLEHIRRYTDRAVATTDAAVREVKRGTETTGAASETFGRIVASIRHVADQAQEVSAATEQMSASSEEVAASIAESARIAKEASQLVRTASSASERQLATMKEISALALDLRDAAHTAKRDADKFKTAAAARED